MSVCLSCVYVTHCAAGYTVRPLGDLVCKQKREQLQHDITVLCNIGTYSCALRVCYVLVLQIGRRPTFQRAGAPSLVKERNAEGLIALAHDRITVWPHIAPAPREDARTRGERDPRRLSKCTAPPLSFTTPPPLISSTTLHCTAQTVVHHLKLSRVCSRPCGPRHASAFAKLPGRFT